MKRDSSTHGGTLQTVGRLLGGARLITPSRFSDPRGTFSVTFESAAAAELGLPDRFVQDNHSVSYEVGTIRGIHLQLPLMHRASSFGSSGAGSST